MSDISGVKWVQTHAKVSLCTAQSFCRKPYRKSRDKKHRKSEFQEMKTVFSDQVGNEAKPPKFRKKRRVIPTLISNLIEIKHYFTFTRLDICN